MCGIFGYVSSGQNPKAKSQKRDNAVQVVFEGLKRLEYRGYDSWGIAYLTKDKGLRTKDKIVAEKHIGPVSSGNNSSFISHPSSLSIGHTRWATHGKVTDKNAHPHFSTDKSFVVAHNGIVENFEELKSLLKKQGFKFETETDTEVIVRLIEQAISKKRQAKSYLTAVIKTIKKIEGRNTFIVLTNGGEIIAARNGSPLVVGIDHGSFYFSSDTLSFSKDADKTLFIDNGQVVVYDGKLKLFNSKDGKEIKKKFEKITVRSWEVGKEGYEHYMLKEINESPYVLKQLIKQDEKKLKKLAAALKKAKNVYTIGSGTTGLAAAQIGYFLRVNSEVNATSLVGADSFEYFNLFSKKDLLIVPSQSGETADVLEVLERARERGAKIATNVNMAGSMMTKLSDYKFQTLAGPEICVVSTKVFVAHIAWGYLLSKTVQGKYLEGIKNLQLLRKSVENYLSDKRNLDSIKKIAKKLVKRDHIFLLGKAQNLQIVREGMIKLIETSYKHAHAMPSGDLKHYAITLMEKEVPVIVAVSEDEVKSDVLNAVSEVKARGVDVIGLSSENHKDFDYLLKVPELGEMASIMNVIVLQLLAYYIAVELGNNVDRPRNIAKSVTVK